MKDKNQCPYCGRKIKYFQRLTEHNMGEHECSHCKKKSNIKQEGAIWGILFIAALFAVIIMLMYFTCSKSVIAANEAEGKFKLLMFFFFGGAMEIKWLLWELLPFVAFYFLSPLFMTFTPQQRYMVETTTSIDLGIPTELHNTASIGSPKPETNTRVIPKADEAVFSGEYEDISSSSGMDKTRAFSVNDINQSAASEKININSQPTSVSNSYKSDVPLKRIYHEPQRVETEEDDARVYVREEKEEKKAPAKTGGNFSANRKF